MKDQGSPPRPTKLIENQSKTSKDNIKSNKSKRTQLLSSFSRDKELLSAPPRLSRHEEDLLAALLHTRVTLELHRVTPKIIQLHGTTPNYAELHRIKPNYAKLHRITPNYTELHTILHRITLNYTELHRISPNYTELRQITANYSELNRIVYIGCVILCNLV